MSDELKKFHLELDEPVAVSLQPANEQRIWGRWQFPDLHRTENGHILASFEYGTDSYQYEAGTRYMVSEDDGKSWRPRREADRPVYTKMPNGKYFVGFVKKGCYKTDYPDAYTPILADGNRTWYLADDIAEETDKKVYAMEYDPSTGKTDTFECKINWPNLSLVMYPGYQIYPVTMMFALCNEAGIHVIDGNLYYVLYWSGYDAAEQDRSRLAEKTGPYHVYIFRSCDCGHTWELFSQLLSDRKRYDTRDGTEGYAEPHIARMPDGSWIMLIRTGSNHPSLISRSVDNCKTWSEPEEFDSIGVFPQILPLPCGVTIASYGRPEMRIRATSDPSGLRWEAPVTVDLSVPMPGESCYYTHLLPLDDSSALIIYSDFQYPDADGNRVKAIVTRRIRVVMD
ncbi:MAG: exo-alpha-sialidase [Clostridia bacterium]|nr:exo-alpha-sialidase [Clostridia bacterium]